MILVKEDYIERELNNNLIKGLRYYVLEYETKIDNKLFYSLFIAKFLRKENYFHERIILTNINHITEKRISKCISYIPSKYIIKMESLFDITNEMLPNDILKIIDSYI